MKIYISLPISGVEEEARKEAEKVKQVIKNAGHEPVSPFDIYAGENPNYYDHLCADIRVLMDCDAIYHHNHSGKRWADSCGCWIEHAVANNLIMHRDHKIKILHGLDDLEDLYDYLKEL